MKFRVRIKSENSQIRRNFGFLEIKIQNFPLELKITQKNLGKLVKPK
jgi:hypothetical protein